VFDGDRDVQDALVANRKVTGADPSFRIPREGGDLTVTLPDFIRTKGTAFLLYPSRSTLQGLSTSGMAEARSNAGSISARRNARCESRRRRS
jgi:hypothetical protein